MRGSMSIPSDFGEQIARLHPGTMMGIPDALLGEWFPPGVRDGSLDVTSMKAAQDFAARHGCSFRYFPNRGGDCLGEGCFARL